jgi:signal transduction histidine kinase
MKLKLTILLFFYNSILFYSQTDSVSIKKVDAMIEDFYNVTYNNPDSALKILDSAEALAKRINSPRGVTSVMRQRGIFYCERSDYIKSMSLLLKALRMDESIHNDDGIGMDLLFIGLNYFQQEKEKDALPYMEKALQKYVDLKDEAGIALVNSNLGMVYRTMNRFDDALKSYSSVRDFYIKNNNERNLSRVENNIGNVYKDQKLYDKALEHYIISKDLKEKENDAYGLIIGYSNIADIYTEKKEFIKAFDYYSQALKIAKDQKSINLQKDVHFDLAHAYELQGDFKKAFENYQVYSTLKDSSISEEYNNDLAEMKVKYESDKKEGENIILKKDNELQETKIRDERKQKFLYAFLLGIAFFAGSVVFIQYRNKKKLNSQLELINEKVNTQNITLRSLNRELIESEENLTIANETKDQLISMLSHDLYNPVTSVINYSAGILEKSEELSREELIHSFEKVNNGVIPLQDLLDNILQWARIQKKSIEPNVEKTDLQKIIRNVVELYSPAAAFKKIAIKVNFEGNQFIKTDRLMMNFIIRNLVNNAVKFCITGRTISININNSPDKISISVKDEGRGFSSGILQKLNNKNIDETVQAEGSGIGLSVSRQFVKLLNGDIEFRNMQNGGAEVIISFIQA